MKTVALLWMRFGPYHLARLDGAARMLHRRGVRVVGIEVAGSDHYAWDPVEVRSATYERYTLFPDCEYQSLSRREIHQAVHETLDLYSPAAVGINGWAVPEAHAALGWALLRGRTRILFSETHREASAARPVRDAARGLIARRFNAALVGGRRQKAMLTQMGFPANAIHYGYDAVDEKWFASRDEDPDQPQHVPYFFANTRFLPRKKIDVLLRAMAAYRERVAPDQPWHLVISGDGECASEWKALAAELGLDNVEWPGFVQYDELARWYQNAGAFVHPAAKEAWGLVLNEAAAASLPIIAAERVGSRHELVRHGWNGFVVEPDSVESLTNALVAVHQMEEATRRRMGDRSRDLGSHWNAERFGRGLALCLEQAGVLRRSAKVAA